MKKQTTIKEALEIWADHTDDPCDHIPVARLLCYAMPEGLKDAQACDLHHLSLCPQCQDEWNMLSDLDGDVQEKPRTDDPYLMGYGLLKAAKSKLTRPLELTSTCGRFTLGIYPNEQNPENGLLVFNTTQKNLEGAEVLVLDAKGRQLINGLIRGLKAVQTTQLLSDFDFSSWNVVVTPAAGKGKTHG